jgi:dCMP deaminase
MAQLVSTWSKDPSTQVGAVIVDSNRRVVSVGFNGFPQNMPDNPEWYSNRDEKYSRIIHAEINAKLFARGDLTGCTLYTWPLCTCDRCIVQLAQVGISRFVAPKLPDRLQDRWGEYTDRSHKYAKDMNLEFVLV